MKGWVKKLIMIVGAVASLIIIGTSVSGWIGNKDTKTEDKTNTEINTETDTEVQVRGGLFYNSPTTRSSSVESIKEHFFVGSALGQRVIVSIVRARINMVNITATSGCYRKNANCWALAHAQV